MNKPAYYNRLPYAEKIIADWPSLANEVSVQRAKGRPIVLTNGVFDLLHPGHLLKLADCRRSKADYLVVSLDADLKVLLNKGRWPALTAYDRAALIAALTGVDAVTLHGGGYAGLLDLARLLRPDRWHRREDAPDAEIAGMAAMGCEIVCSPRNGEWSSTALRGG